MTKCFYCKATGQTVAHVKACAVNAGNPVSTTVKAGAPKLVGQAAKDAWNAPLPKKTVPTLDEVLGDDINPDPKAELDKWQAAEQDKIAQYNADLAKVEIGVIIEDKPAAPSLPAHKAAKLAMFGTTGKVAPAVVEKEITATVAVMQESKTASPAPAPVINFKALVEENKAAKAATGKTGQDLELGMYAVKNEAGEITQVYKIEWNKYKTFKLAKMLVISQKQFFNKETSTWEWKPSGKFVYAKSMIFKLTEHNKMNDADAKTFHDMTKAKYGQDYGFCCVCGKLLTVKKSIAAGIGPVCQSKF